MMNRAIVSLSGGLDSTVLLAHCLEMGVECRALSVFYGQRHKCEIMAAAEITRHYGVEHKVVDLSNLREVMSGSSQTDSQVSVPEGHYEEESMKLTVVPNRNMLLLAVAGAWAVSVKADSIAYAAHAGDHAIYPDCRPEFAKAMAKALRLCDWHSVELVRPFLEPTPMSKTDIVLLGHKLGVPFAKTWSCYKGDVGKGHCGKCGTCTERREAFSIAGIADPVQYAA